MPLARVNTPWFVASSLLKLTSTLVGAALRRSTDMVAEARGASLLTATLAPKVTLRAMPSWKLLPLVKATVITVSVTDTILK
ncbi:hypothetical protein CHKEEEPN_1510 [Methylorubrum podarium]|nr:hypothetical protein CHKEEEPN_1510 [Methylorubrum podarium]